MTTASKQVFDLSHTNPMGWAEFHGIVNALIERLEAYQAEQGIAFAATAPILRSGAVPAVMIANRLRIVPMIPLQLKYDYGAGQIAAKVPPAVPADIDAAAPLHVLVIECNSNTGKSAALAAQLLQQALPNAALHFVCVTRVYGGAVPAGYASQHVGCLTNENFVADAPATLRPGITVFPWETAAFELEDINA